MQQDKSSNLGRIAASVLLLGMIMVVSACQAETGLTVIEMTNALKFVPAKVTIPAGTTVEWYNASDLVHTVTDDPAKAARSRDAVLPEKAETFDSGNIRTGARYRHRFTAPGIYRYFCMPHEGTGMVGKIIVTP